MLSHYAVPRHYFSHQAHAHTNKSSVLDVLNSFAVYWVARRAGALGVVGTPHASAQLAHHALVPGSGARGARPLDERLVSGGGTPLGTPVPPDGPAQCDAGLGADLGVRAAARRCHSSRSSFPCVLEG